MPGRSEPRAVPARRPSARSHGAVTLKTRFVIGDDATPAALRVALAIFVYRTQILDLVRTCLNSERVH